MTLAMTTDAITVTIQPADSDAAVTRERRYASKGRAAVNLEVYRDRGSVVVRWNVNRGRGWSKCWRATRASEAEAMAFVAEKWPALLTWLEQVEPIEGGGAAEAFSAQVATMLR